MKSLINWLKSKPTPLAVAIPTLNLTPQVVYLLHSPKQIATPGTTNFAHYDIGIEFINSSNFYVEAVVDLNLKCYGQILKVPNKAYYGENSWTLPPNLYTYGHFKINDLLLKPVSRELAQLIKAEESDVEALTIAPTILCKSIPHGHELRIPPSLHHFNFRTCRWILDI